MKTIQSKTFLKNYKKEKEFKVSQIYLSCITKYNWYLSNLVAFLRINLFERIDLQKWIDEPLFKKYLPARRTGKPPDLPKQEVLFDI